MKRILLTATVQSHIALFYSHLALKLHENGFEVHAAASNDLADKDGLELKSIDRVYDVCFARAPSGADNIRAYRELRRIVSENKYDIIHCNTPMGGFLTRLASRKLRKDGAMIIYTAHGFHFFKGAPLLNWLLYYPIERWMARYTDVLITINKEDYAQARKFKAGKVSYIAGVGIDIDSIDQTIIDREKKREELDIPEDCIVLLSVGELNQNKNHELAIRALSMLQNKSVRYIICGRGSRENYLKDLSSKRGVENQVHFIDTDLVLLRSVRLQTFLFFRQRERACQSR